MEGPCLTAPQGPCGSWITGGGSALCFSANYFCSRRMTPSSMDCVWVVVPADGITWDTVCLGAREHMWQGGKTAC